MRDYFVKKIAEGAGLDLASAGRAYDAMIEAAPLIWYEPLEEACQYPDLDELNAAYSMLGYGGQSLEYAVCMEIDRNVIEVRG